MKSSIAAEHALQYVLSPELYLARALLHSTLGRTPIRFWRQCWCAWVLEECSSAALLQSTQPALFHASTTRITDAACSSDD